MLNFLRRMGLLACGTQGHDWEWRYDIHGDLILVANARSAWRSARCKKWKWGELLIRDHIAKLERQAAR